MKEIRFNEVTLSEWRAQNRTVKFTDHTRVSGRNKSGKSTTWDAILWLFTGYDSQDRSNYQLFDNRVVPTKETSKPASVELSLSIDGYEYKLKRTAEMGWTRPRGASVYEKKSSDDYSFAIDGVEVTASAYKEFIENNFCAIDKLKFILNIGYYLTLEWKELRKHFADIIGEVSREDYDGDFSEVFSLIDRYGSTDAAKAYLKTQRQPMRDAIGDGNAKGTKIIELETLESTLPDISGCESAASEMDRIKLDIADIDNEIAGRSDSIRPLIEQRNRQIAEISQMKSALSESKSEYERSYYQEIAKLQSEIAAVDSENRQIEYGNRNGLSRIQDARRGLDSATVKLKAYQEYRETLLEQNREVKALQFTSENCPYCGQPLPEDKLEESRKKFKEEKEARHARIVAEGQRNNADIETCRKDIVECQKIIDEGFTETPLKSKSDLETKLADLRASFVPYEQSAEYKEKTAEIARKEANIADIPSVDTQDLQRKKEMLYERQSELSEVMANKKSYDRQMQRISALREDIRNTANELAKLEGLLAEFDEMERQKAEIIRRKVSALFKVCDVEMEERKKDGTMTPCCNILVGGVKAQVLNSASQVLAGADISNAFARHFGLNMPLMVDNRERIDTDVDFGSERQVIEFTRSDNDFKVE